MTKPKHKSAAAPKTEGEYLKLIRKEEINGRHQGVIDLATAAALSFPDNWQFPYLQALAKYNAAEDNLFSFASPDDFPPDQQNLLNRIEALCDSAIYKMYDAQVDDLRPHALLGSISRIRKDFDAAESHYLYGFFICKISGRQRPLELLSGYGWTLHALGRNEEAEASFREGHETNNAHVDSALGYGMMLILRKRSDLALKVFKMALIHNPGDEELIFGRDSTLHGLAPRP